MVVWVARHDSDITAHESKFLYFFTCKFCASKVATVEVDPTMS